MTLTYRLATLDDKEKIWEILQQAISRRKADGSNQWQDGYPNANTVLADIETQQGFVFLHNENTIAYAAFIFNYEPAYNNIEGNWVSNDDFFVVHRVAVSDDVIGKGIATQIFKLLELHAQKHNVFSIKVDTNFDNLPMLKILEKLGYQYCGEVKMRGGNRKAFEKILE